MLTVVCILGVGLSMVTVKWRMKPFIPVKAKLSDFH